MVDEMKSLMHVKSESQRGEENAEVAIFKEQIVEN